MQHNMKAWLVFLIWALSIVSFSLISDLDNKWFWVSVSIFAFTSIYMSKHYDRMIIEIEEFTKWKKE